MASETPVALAKPFADLAITRLMVLLTFGTGVVDAAGYIGLHKVFVANMTGNVVFIGLGLAGTADLPVVRSLIALAGFAAGALLGGRYQRGLDPQERIPRRTVLLLSAVAVLLGGLTVAFAIRIYSGWGLEVATAVFAIAMGLQAAAARRLAVTDVSTVVITSTLASLAADSRLAGGPRTRQLRRLGAVLAMLLGACAGALLVRLHLAVPLGLACVIALVVSLALVRLRVTAARRASRPDSARSPGRPVRAV
jgi:uncharacterized membrane protein YoaK (UPF0700 family)